MKGLTTLIRLHKSTVDERRRVLTALQDQRQRLVEELVRLEQELLREQAVAAGTLEASMTYAGFARHVIHERDRLNRAIAAMDAQIARAEESVAEAFQELKRYELALEEQKRRQTEEFKRRETQRLDETASVRFSRRQAEEP